MPNELGQNEVMQLIKQLIDMWSYWDENRSFYLEKLIPQLKEDPSSGTKDEQLLFQKLKNICIQKEWEDLAEIVKLGLIEQTLARINQCLTHFDFDEADKFYEKIADNYPREMYQDIREKALTKKKRLDQENFVMKIKKEITELLEMFDYESAREKWFLIKEEFPESEYIILENESKKNKEQSLFRNKIYDLLSKGKFANADQEITSSDLMSIVDYLYIKADHLQNIVNNSYQEGIDEEQAQAISAYEGHKLISARAGSGKTRVLACITSILIDLYQIDLDEIMVLAFNRKAADEIRERIKIKFKKPLFENARTFHSLAYQLAPTEDILYDGKADIITKNLSLFVQRIVKRKIKNIGFILKVYSFFRREYLEIEKSGVFLDDQEYYDFRRNLRWVTLNGERVKSVGEKYIADFLFEQEVSYIYEDACFWDDGIYRPDFKIIYDSKQYIWEHWGIDPDNPKRGISHEWGISWSEYNDKIEQKRQYWRSREVPLIETSIKDLDQGREEFERKLRNKLLAIGLTPNPLSQDAIITKLREKDYVITHLTKIFVSFIQHAKKRRWTVENIAQKIAEYVPNSVKEKEFLELAKEIFLEYEVGLSTAKPKKLIDFDDMMIRAVEKVNQTKGECKISIGYSKTRSIYVNKLRWILIDEYQDFSQLFYELIKSICRYNPTVKVICVGDDWQAINSFAGSNLCYFTDFNKYFNPSETVNLLTNHRSKKKIVRIGNELMKGRGEPGQSHPSKSGGEIKRYFIDDVWLEIRKIKEHQKVFLDDQKYIIHDLAKKNDKDEGYTRLIASKYVKLCSSIIIDSENSDLKTVILCRTNYIEGVSLDRFKHQLNFALDEQGCKFTNGKIEVYTVHSYKGGESDLVILLNVCNGSFPLLHPDNTLFGIFGKNLVDAMDEERRLFYVALTRAEEKLFIISDRDNSSVFLNSLSIPIPGLDNFPWEKSK